MRSPYSPWTAGVFIWTLFLLLAESKPLLPYKNVPRVLPRSAWKREVVPKDVATLSYAPEGINFRTSSLTFTAHESVPIMMLEDIEFLVETVVCHVTDDSDDESIVEITFTSEDAYATTLATWASLSKFMLVTSHPGCNPSDQRGAWLVSSVSEEDFKSAVSLQVNPIPLHEMGSSFRISHISDSVSTGWRSESESSPRLHGRVSDVFPINKTFDFAPRQQLLPIDPSLIDSSITDPNALPDPEGLQVFCVDCVSAVVFSVGIEMDIAVDLTVNEAWVNVTVNDFEHDVNLEISLDAAHTFNDVFDVFLVPVPDLGFSIADIATIGFFWGGAILTELDVSAPLNFTVGASASIPTGATATFVANNITQSSATGWDKASFNIHPFRLNNGSFDLTAGISLSPFLDATVAFFGGAGSSVRMYMNTPHVTGAATLVTSVNRECQPIAPNDFESFADALTFGAGLNISLEGTSSGAHFPDDDKIFLTKGLPFGDLPTLGDPKCMIIVNDNPADTSGSSIAALLPAVTGTLIAASAAIPTFNIPGIESYYSAHGALPTNVNYTQMLMATTVPADIKAAVQQAGTPHNKHHSKVAAIVGGVIGALAAIMLLCIGVWYLRFRQSGEKFEDPTPWSIDPQTAGPGLTPGTEKELPPWPKEPLRTVLEEPISSMPALGWTQPSENQQEYQPWAEEYRQPIQTVTRVPVPQEMITSTPVPITVPQWEQPLRPQRRAPAPAADSVPTTSREQELEQRVLMMESQIASLTAALSASGRS
ncbi:hypothetical protein B0H11DRAFT_1948489 [Mycena galericulata]|nr:hypothetical protein B0H11DRAFT_1948489 [Mycena galericulata]